MVFFTLLLVTGNTMAIAVRERTAELAVLKAIGVRDGSNLTADMAVQNVLGDAFRGATGVSLHNGGGVLTGLSGGTAYTGSSPNGAQITWSMSACLPRMCFRK